jgi:hypothetical protein
MAALFGPSEQDLERLRSAVQSLGTTSVPGLAAALSWRARKAERLLAHELGRPGTPIAYDPGRRTVRWARPVPIPSTVPATGPPPIPRPEIGRPPPTPAPVEVADDPQSLTAEEIAEAAHTARALAAELFDDSGRPQVVTAAVLNRLINSLPRAADARTIDIASRDGLWGRVVGGAPRIDDADAGKAQAALVFESCRRGATYVQGLTLRRCLEASHDALMSTMNGELWQVLGAGS